MLQNAFGVENIGDVRGIFLCNYEKESKRQYPLNTV